jgi:opacity protein-like surface antigen
MAIMANVLFAKFNESLIRKLMDKIALVLVACFSLLTNMATAAENAGAYIGIAAGIAESNAIEKGFTYSSTTQNQTKRNGAKVYAGYSWGVWGVEAGYYDFNKYNVVGIASGVSSADQYGINAFGLSGVGNYAISPNFFLTGKLGLAMATLQYKCIRACIGISDQSTNSVAPLFGVGLKWNVVRNFAVRIDYEGVDHITSKFGPYSRATQARLLSLGLEGHF